VTRRRLLDLLPAVALVLVLIGLGVYVAVSGVGGSHGPTTAPLPSGGVLSSAPSTPVAPSSPTAPTTSSLAPPSLPTCLAPTTVKVLTFNIHGGRHPNDTLDLPRVESEIKASGADIVLLQEVHDGMYVTHFVDEPAVLSKALGMYAAFGINLVNPEPGGRPDGKFGTLILSHYPIESYTNTLLPHPMGQQRGLMQAIVSVDGVRLDVWNTHLENGSPDARLEQIKAVKTLIAKAEGDAAGNEAHAMIFGGDLNASATGPVARVARSIAHDTWRQIGSGPGYTVPEWAPRNRIDYLFHNSWLKPLAMQVLPSGVSDHRSVWAEYALYSKAGCASGS